MYILLYRTKHMCLFVCVGLHSLYSVSSTSWSSTLVIDLHCRQYSAFSCLIWWLVSRCIDDDHKTDTQSPVQRFHARQTNIADRLFDSRLYSERKRNKNKKKTLIKIYVCFTRQRQRSKSIRSHSVIALALNFTKMKNNKLNWAQDRVRTVNNMWTIQRSL